MQLGQGEEKGSVLSGVPHPEWKLATLQTLGLSFFPVILCGKGTSSTHCIFHMSVLEMLSYVHNIFQEPENIIIPFLTVRKT